MLAELALDLRLTGAYFARNSNATGKVAHIASMLKATAEDEVEAAARDWLKGRCGVYVAGARVTKSTASAR